jgi:GTP cyclohydrolase IA
VTSAPVQTYNGHERARSQGSAPLRIVHAPPRTDLVAAEKAAAEFLSALGVELDTESRLDTPRRMSHAYAEMLRPRPFDLTTFPNDEAYDELVVARSIPVQSVCEHHMLPFVGVAHVGYLPGARILGLSKLARVVELFARRPQVQERLTQQVADWLETNLAPRGVGVVVEAEHLCMTVRGVRAPGATTVTSALHGQLRADAASRVEFFALANQQSGRQPLKA